jgi:hypothetical protein
MSEISKSISGLSCTINEKETLCQLILTYDDDYDSHGRECVMMDLEFKKHPLHTLEFYKEDLEELAKALSARLSFKLWIYYDPEEIIYYDDDDKSITIYVEGTDGDKDEYYRFLLTDNELTELDKIIDTFLSYFKK